jgi:hypothetical protein
MSEQDREAFVRWFCAEFGIAPSACTPESSNAWAGWQACSDHYAPKLTEKKAECVIAKARGKEIALPSHEVSSEEIVAALRAAGIRFKEAA